MVSAILDSPVLYIYGKTSSGKTVTLKKVAYQFSSYYKKINFFSPNRKSVYNSLSEKCNISIHTVESADTLVSQISALDKDSIIIVDDTTLLFSGHQEWIKLDKEIQALGMRKVILSLQANPLVLNDKHNISIPTFRCDQQNNETILFYQEEKMSLDIALKLVNRRLFLDDYCLGI